MAIPLILVVDDDPSIVTFLQDALADEGYHVMQAVGGASLLVAQTMHPAVILLDIMMPGMDGVEVSRRLRIDPATADIPIIAMSAVADRGAMAALPVDGQLPKPFELDQLYDMVGRWAV